MKIIHTFTDKEILGTEGLSKKAPRLTARAIIQRKDGLFAVIYLGKYDLFCLPGGGVETGESPEEALCREVLEETGCSCDEIAEIGRVQENRACLDYTQDNHYFFVKTVHAPAPTQMTAKEIANKTEVQWYPFAEIYRRIAAPKHDNVQRKYIQARDKAALEAFAARKEIRI